MTAPTPPTDAEVTGGYLIATNGSPLFGAPSGPLGEYERWYCAWLRARSLARHRREDLERAEAAIPYWEASDARTGGTAAEHMQQVAARHRREAEVAEARAAEIMAYAVERGWASVRQPGQQALPFGGGQ